MGEGEVVCCIGKRQKDVRERKIEKRGEKKK